MSDLKPKTLENNSALKCASSGHFTAVKNSSWSECYVAQYGNRSGYLICHSNQHSEMEAIGVVIGLPMKPQIEIDANARLFAESKNMASFIEKIAALEEIGLAAGPNELDLAKQIMERLKLKETEK